MGLSYHLMVNSERDSMRGVHLEIETCQPVISSGSAPEWEEQNRKGRKPSQGVTFRQNPTNGALS